MQEHVEDADFRTLKIYSRRMAQDLVNWFALTNPLAYEWRYEKVVLYGILKTKDFKDTLLG